MLKIFFLFLLSSSVVCLLFLWQTPIIYHNFGRQILQSHTIEDISTSEQSEEELNKEVSYPSNLPEVYLNNSLKRPTRFNKTCAKFPLLFDIKYRNDLWQIQKTTYGTLHLFSAYLDERNGSVIRILGMYDQYQPKSRFYCQFWFNNTEKPAIVLAEPLFWLFRSGWGADRDNLYQPYLITCPLQLNIRMIPSSVSLVEKSCDTPSNNLRVFHKTVDEKKNFVVCVKGLDFPFEDKSARLAEWIELLHILGAEKINFYEFNIHPKTKKLLDYYKVQGKVKVTPLTLVGDSSNYPYLQDMYLHSMHVQRRLQEVIPYNDCLYKHIQEFRYVVLLDTDEVIVPEKDTWVELMDTMQKNFKDRASYLARNVYFFDTYQHDHSWFVGIPKHMHMLQHVYRAKNYTKPGYFVKGFHDTSRVLGLHNHYPFLCYRGCALNEINLTLAHLQHYRADCVKGIACDYMKNETVMDTRIWNYKDELIERVGVALKYLKMSYR